GATTCFFVCHRCSPLRFLLRRRGFGRRGLLGGRSFLRSRRFRRSLAVGVSRSEFLRRGRLLLGFLRERNARLHQHFVALRSVERGRAALAVLNLRDEHAGEHLAMADHAAIAFATTIFDREKFLALRLLDDFAVKRSLSDVRSANESLAVRLSTDQENLIE